MMSTRSHFSLLVATTLLVGLVLSESNGNENKDLAPTASKPQQEPEHQQQQQQAVQLQKPEQQFPASLSSKLLPAINPFSFYSPYPTADDESDAILVPYNSFLDEDFDGDIGEAEFEAGDGEVIEDPEDMEKRYMNRFVGKRMKPRFVGKRYQPRFVGKRFKPRFVGKRYAPRFVGKRYAPRFVGKRYKPRFVGKRYKPRFVGKRAAEQTNDEAAAHSIHKRQAPRFIGKRDGYEPLGVASWVLGENDNDFDDDTDYFREDSSGSSGCSDNGVDKRGPPRFVGKRGAPRFVGKRGSPRFVGKRYHQRFVGKRGAPRFVGKRAPPRFVGKRAEDELNDYLLQLELLNEVYNQKRAAPRFVGKKSVFSDFNKNTIQEKDVQSFLDDWSRQEAIKKLVANDKRWSSPVTPSFIGKRMINDDFKR